MTRRNFTLLEVLLASVIFALVLTTAFMGLFGIQKAWDQIHRRNLELERLVRIERVVDSAFRNAVPFSWPDDEGVEKSIFEGDKERVSFAYLHRAGNPLDGAIRFITLFRDGDRLVAEYRNSPLLPWGKSGAVNSEVLSDNVAEISFLYADKKTDMNEESIVWSNDWDEKENENMPLAIQLSVEWKDGVSERWLRRTAGSGLSETFGKRKIKTNELNSKF